MIDGVFLRAVRKELLDWRDARVQQVRQPGDRTIVLEMYAGGRGETRLLVDAGQRPRVHLARQTWPNAPVPPAFCQLLRARLVGARLADAVMEGLERVLALRFDGQDDLGRPVTWWLYVEIMGRRSNAVLVDGEGRIVDALRRASPGDNPARPVWPGLRYEWPPRPDGWRDVVTMEPQSWRAWAAEAAAAAAGARGRGDVASAVMAAAPGAGLALARDVARRAGVDADSPWHGLTPAERDRILDVLAERLAQVRADAFHPCRLTAGGRTVAFAALELSPAAGERLEIFRSASALLEAVHRETETTRRRTELQARLLRVARAALERARRKLERQRAEWNEARDADDWRLQGELLTAYLHQVPAGEDRVALPDWTRDNAPRVIELDPRLSPAANAQRYFRKYQKARRRLAELLPLLEATEAEVEALADVVAALANLPPLAPPMDTSGPTPAEARDAPAAPPGGGASLEDVLRVWDETLASAEARLADLGLWEVGPDGGAGGSSRGPSRSGGKGPDRRGPVGDRDIAVPAPQGAPGLPRRYLSSDGWTIWVGRNSRQNDWLTLRFARPDDWWFHTKDIPGTHVLARPPEGWPAEDPPPGATLREAAALAAFFSRARHSANVPVDYTRRRYVRRIRGAGPGQVYYDHQRTVFVTPSESVLPQPWTQDPSQADGRQNPSQANGRQEPGMR